MFSGTHQELNAGAGVELGSTKNCVAVSVSVTVSGAIVVERGCVAESESRVKVGVNTPVIARVGVNPRLRVGVADGVKVAVERSPDSVGANVGVPARAVASNPLRQRKPPARKPLPRQTRQNTARNNPPRIIPMYRAPRGLFLLSIGLIIA